MAIGVCVHLWTFYPVPLIYISVNQNYNEMSPHTGQNGHYQKPSNNKCWRECGERGTRLHCWWDCKLLQPSLVAQLVKNPPAIQETWAWSLAWEDPWRRERLPTPVFWPREFHGLCVVHGVAKSWTWLSDFHFHFSLSEEASDTSVIFCFMFPKQIFTVCLF